MKMSLSQEIKKQVLGKKIIKIELNRFSTKVFGNPFTYDPVIILEDGTRITFNVIETEVGTYGVEPIIVSSEVTTE
jgi:hypothetical protein